MGWCRAGWLIAAWLLTAASPSWALGIWQVSVKAGGGSTVTVTLANASSAPVWALVPGTVLDGTLVEDVFAVTQQSGLGAGTYVGPVAKRRQPVADNYHLFQPGDAVTRDVNVSALYRVPLDGVYDVQLVQHLEYRMAPPDLTATSLPTHEQILRTAPVSIALAADSLSTRLRAPQYAACTAAQQSDILLAGEAAENMVSVAVTDLSSLTPAQRQTSPRYTRWFGDVTDARFNAVEQNFRNVEKVLQDESLSFNCGCDLQGVFAYVRIDDPYNVFLCPAFWRAGVEGTDSRAGTIVHELSHFQIVAGTRDHVYGQAGAASLALSNPDRAVENADNHEYFAENTPALAVASDDAPPPVDITFVDLPSDAVIEQVSLAAGQRHFYTTSDTTRISLTPESGDADLFVYADTLLRERLCGSVNRNAETDHCAPVRTGPVYVEVRGVADAVYTLRAETASVGAGLASLQVDLPVLGAVSAGDRLTYRVEGAQSVRLSTLSGVADLYVLSDPDDLSSVVCASTGAVTDDECALPDNYSVLFPHVVGVTAAQFEIVASSEIVAPAGGVSARGAGAQGYIASLIIALMALVARRPAIRRPAPTGASGLGALLLVVLLLAGCSQPPVVSPSPPPPGVWLVAVLEPSETGPSWVRFSVENRGGDSATVPVWGTPLESPILGDYFTVQRGGVSLLYRGPMAKRSLEGSPEIALAPGERATAEIDLAELYNLRAPSYFSATFRVRQANGTQWLRQGVPLAGVEGRVEQRVP